MRGFVSIMASLILSASLIVSFSKIALAEENEEPQKELGAPPADPGDGIPEVKAPIPQGADAPVGAAEDHDSDNKTDDANANDNLKIKMHPKAPVEKAQVEKKASSKKIAAKKIKNKKSAKTKVALKTKEAPVSPTGNSAKLDADTILKWLKNGNTRFVKKNFRSDGKSPADRERTAMTEAPHAAILADADSRVVPEIIFDQGLGEVYTVRSFGENIDDSTLAALEYAVGKLNVPLLIVMGNSDSAALQAMSASKTNENGDEVGDSPKSESFESVFAEMRPRLKTVSKDPPSSHFEVEATLNADGIARELVKRSDIIAKAVASGHLKIKPALYRLNTGKVSFY